MTALGQPSARERILSAAYELFARHGVRAVTVDELIARSGVANATFYRHFSSKDDLVLAFLDRREELWTLGTIVAQATSRDTTPRGQLLAIFDIFDEWFHRSDYEGDPFITVLLEMGPDAPLGRASLEHLDTMRSNVRMLAERAGLRDPEEFARSWQILMKGAILTASMGDSYAGQRAHEMGVWLIDHYEPQAADRQPVSSARSAHG